MTINIIILLIKIKLFNILNNMILFNPLIMYPFIQWWFNKKLGGGGGEEVCNVENIGEKHRLRTNEKEINRLNIRCGPLSWLLECGWIITS